ncbi:MAG TPA: hypothetical protein VGB30_03190 [bacterium]
MLRNFIIVFATITIASLYTGCVNIEDDGDKVQISPAGVHVEDSDGGTVDVGIGGVNIDDGEGNTVDVDGSGVSIQDEDGSSVEVNSEGVRTDDGNGETVNVNSGEIHVHSEDMETLPEEWPDTVSIPDGYTITDFYIRQNQRTNEEIQQIDATGDLKLEEIAEYYKYIENATLVTQELNTGSYNSEFKFEDRTLRVHAEYGAEWKSRIIMELIISNE